MTQFVEKWLTNCKTISHMQETLLHIFRPHHPWLHRTTELSEGVQTAQRTALCRHTSTTDARHVTTPYATIVLLECWK